MNGLEYGIPILGGLAFVFLVLWILSSARASRLEYDAILDREIMEHYRHKASLFDQHYKLLTASPVACPICGKYMKGGANCAIVVAPDRGLHRVVHVHAAHIKDVLEKSPASVVLSTKPFP